MDLLRLLLAVWCFIAAAPVSAQFSDSFADGDFKQNPAWQGDTSLFQVNAAGELQLNATVAGTADLAVQGNFPAGASWDLRFRLAFSPSSSNLLRIYLQADQQQLSVANGYYLEIGESGSADALRLYRQNGASSTLLGVGVAGLVATNPDIHLSVTRTGAGAWTVAAAAGSGSLEQQFTASDAVFSGGSNLYFGFHCLYTVSNIAKFFFDDITVDVGPADTDPPVLLSASADDETQVTAVFNEALSAVAADQFSVSASIGVPAASVLQPDGKTVILTLPQALQTGQYTLECSGIQDLAGNAAPTQSTDFEFVKIETAEEFDILINEIMADPSPAQSPLPEVEWVELYNRSAKTFDLSAFRMQDATGAPVSLPSYSLAPGAYVALTAIPNATALQAATSGPVLGIPFGISTLNNDSDIITLSDAAGNVIDHVAYDIDWHDVPDKKNGGWSLERINPNLPCLEAANWRSCLSAPGGTPGLANTVLSNTPDATAPRLLKILVESASSLLITFSEGMDPQTLTSTQAYLISPNRAVASATPVSVRRDQVRLSLSDPLQPGVLYALRAGSGPADCSGNGVAATDTLLFGLAEVPAAYDVVINEIMYKPAPSAGLPALEWLELYNRSSKIIDLSDLRIQDNSGLPVSLPAYTLAPGRYVAVTALGNASQLQAVTTGDVVAAGISSSLMNDDGDVVSLTDAQGAGIDRVAYTPEWHTEDGKEDGGWSLERINYDLPCLGAENWQSCPVLPGGTPGRQNAAYAPVADEKIPHLLWGYPEAADRVLLTFGEGLDKNLMENAALYQFSPPLSLSSAVQQANHAEVLLHLSEPMETGILYAVTVRSPLADCSGNSVDGLDTVWVGVPQKPEPSDIIVNEVLFNPSSGNSRYVEFLNTGDKVIDWQRCFIGNFFEGTSIVPITQRRISVPGQYHVFTGNGQNVRERYSNIIQRYVLQNTLPSMSDKEGVVDLYWVENGDTVTLDVLHYEADWHNDLYTTGDQEGVALERIRGDLPTNDPANWTSASTLVTGAPGTPTLPNSQRLSEINPAEKMIDLAPARMSPDDDGYEDFLDIRYQLPEEGYAANMAVYDSDGNRAKYLFKQQLTGTEGALRWDGDMENGARARPGIYVLFIELFSPGGTVMRVKKAFSVVAKP